MYKLYKRGDVMAFHAVWEEDGVVVERFGEVGEGGETRTHPIPPGSDEDQVMENLMRPVAKKGFEEIDDADLIPLHVEIGKTGQGGEADLARRHELEDRLDDLLGETGLGHCDGGEFSDRSMAAFCFVVDELIAREVIEGDVGSWPGFERIRVA